MSHRLIAGIVTSPASPRPVYAGRDGQRGRAGQGAREDRLGRATRRGEIASSEEAAASALADAMPEMDFEHRALSGIGNAAVMDNRGSAYLRPGNVTTLFSGKTDGYHRLEPAQAEEVGRRIVANLKAL